MTPLAVLFSSASMVRASFSRSDLCGIGSALVTFLLIKPAQS